MKTKGQTQKQASTEFVLPGLRFDPQNSLRGMILCYRFPASQLESGKNKLTIHHFNGVKMMDKLIYGIFDNKGSKSIKKIHQEVG